MTTPTRTQGFTLMELVVVVVILGIVAAVASEVLSSGLRSYFSSQILTEADWQARLAMERISRDIRTVRSPSDITATSSSSFSYTDINGNASSYSLTGNQVLRTGVVLADSIKTTNSNFVYLDNSGAVTSTNANIRYIMITLNVVDSVLNTNYSVRTTVDLRDLWP